MKSSLLRGALGVGLLATILTASSLGASAPVSTTLAPKNITSTSATLQGKIEPGGLITDLYFISCDPTSSPSFFLQTPTRQTSGTTAKAVSFTLTGLKPGTAYKYAVTAMNSMGKHTGSCVSFTTLPAGSAQSSVGAPTATTLSATEVTSTTATLNGTVNPNGLSTVVRFKSCSASSAAEYFAPTSERNIGSGTTAQSVGYRLSGLVAGRTFKYAVRATNSAGDKIGSCISFKTGAAQIQGKPVVETLPPTNLGATSVTLCGSVNPNGLDTTYSFVSGETNDRAQAYFPKTSERQAGSSGTPLNVTANISGLQLNTHYKYKIQAKNSAGTAVGQFVSFTTGAPTGGAPTVTTNDAYDVRDTSAVLSATINPNGISTTIQFISCDPASATGYFRPVPQPAHNMGNANIAGPQGYTLTGLKPNTTYRYAVTAQNSKGSKKGECKTFKTLSAGADTADVKTLSAQNIQATSFRLRGTVNPNALVTTVWFETCVTDESQVEYFPTTSEQKLAAGTTVKTVTLELYNLFPGVTYKYKILAKNALYTATGDCITATTAAPEPGKFYAQTLPPTKIERSYAMLHGVVNPNWTNCQVNFICMEPKSGGFNLTPKYDRTGTGMQSVDYRVSGLKPGTTYTYKIQLWEKNGIRSTLGQPITFKTPN